MKARCRSKYGDLRKVNQHMNARRRQQWWRSTRRRWKVELRALMPRLDLRDLP